MTKYLAWTGQGADEEFGTLEEAEAFMREEGLVPTGESASDGILEGNCQVYWDGYCDFWVHEGRTLDSYGDGYEPRIRILHRIREASDDED